MACGVFLYHYKDLGTQTFKMGSHYSFGYLKHKLWSKVRNRPDLFSGRQRATYYWKALDESYNFALDRTSIQSLLAKLWGSKVMVILAGAISGVPGEKSHLDVGLVDRCRVYYKGEDGGFLQVRAVMSLVCLCCPCSSQHQWCSNYALSTLCGLCVGLCE